MIRADVGQKRNSLSNIKYIFENANEASEINFVFANIC